MADLGSEFGRLVRLAREAAGLSRADLAAQVGLDPSHLYRIESGGRRPSRESALALAEALQIGDDETNRWLVAAGYSPLPLLSLVRGSVRVRGGRIQPRAAGSTSPVWNAGQWAAWLDAMGLHPEAFQSLMKAIQSASLPARQAALEAVRTSLAQITEALTVPVQSAVIPVAGGHHRLLATHIMQRLLLRAIREAVEAGITDIVLILAPGAADLLYEPLKAALEIAVVPSIQLRYVEQARPMGLGDAILQAESLVGMSPFAVLLPDDVVLKRAGRLTSAQTLSLMMDAFSQLSLLSGGFLIAVSQVPKHKMPSCGIVELGSDQCLPNVRSIKRLAEKPALSDPICRKQNVQGIVGRYLLHPSVFSALRESSGAESRSLELTDALERLRQEGQPIYAIETAAPRQDVGAVLEQAVELFEGISDF